MELFKKVYSGESLSDIERDVSECFDPDFNPKAVDIKTDDHGFVVGDFIVSVVYVEKTSTP